MAGERRLRGLGARRPRRGVVTAPVEVPRRTSGSSPSPAGAAGSAPRSPRSSAAQGAFVVTMDPLVSLDGTEPLPPPEETTAGRIVAAGGSARATSVSVTDGDAVSAASSRSSAGSTRWSTWPGITRPTSFAKGSEEDWRAVLVGAPRRLPQHPRRRAADDGRRRARPDPRRHLGLGVASGRRRRLRLCQARRRRRSPGSWAGRRRRASSSTPCRRSPSPGWSPPRSAARRSGARPARRPRAGCRSARCPRRRSSGPFGAHLVGDGLLVVPRPGAVRRRVRGGGDRRAPSARGGAHRRRGLARRTCSRRSSTGALAPAEAQQATTARQQPAVRAALRRAARRATCPPPPCARAPSSLDRPELAAAVTRALEARGRRVHRRSRSATSTPASTAPPTRWPRRSRRRARWTRSWSPSADPPAATASASDWERVLAEHAGIVEQHPRRRRLGSGRRRPRRRRRASGPAGDAHRRHHGRRPQPGAGVGAARPGWTRAPPATASSAFAVSMEGAARGQPIGELVAHLVCSPDAPALVRRRAGGRPRVVRAPQPPAPERQHHLRRARRPRLAR